MNVKTKKSFNLDPDVRELLALWKNENVGVVESRLFNGALRLALAEFKKRGRPAKVGTP